MIKVKNVNSAPHYNCACGNWLKHWEKFSTQKTPHCAVADCNAPATCGTHAQKADSEDENLYVIPLCDSHAAVTGELQIREGYKLVSANINQTCERW